MGWQRHYLGMISVSVVITLILIFGRTRFPDDSPYSQYLVDYTFGFMRRALAGEIASIVFPQISNFTVSVFGVFSILIAASLYLSLFQKHYGFRLKTLPLLAFLVSSPFFFKEFAHLVGFFDVLGFIVACCALLLPVGRLYPAIITAASVALVLIHHLNFLLYCPVVGVICFFRYVIAGNRYSAGHAAYAVACVLFVSLTFLVVLRYGASPVPREVLLDHMRERALDDFSEGRVEMWYRTISEEMRRTAERLPQQALYLPVYALLILLHLPLIEYFGRTLRSIELAYHRRMAYAALFIVSVGYIAIFVVVFDYNRWLSNWAVCMLLAVHAVHCLPTVLPNRAPIEAHRKRNLYFGWLLAWDFLGGPGTPGLGPVNLRHYFGAAVDTYPL
jgi:hypothetical protein